MDIEHQLYVGIRCFDASWFTIGVDIDTSPHPKMILLLGYIEVDVGKMDVLPLLPPPATSGPEFSRDLWSTLDQIKRCEAQCWGVGMGYHIHIR